MAFWDVPRHGANLVNLEETKDRLAAARRLGVDFVRLAWTLWTSSSSVAEPGAFLVGDLDRYESLIEDDLSRLRWVLDLAHEQELRVVLTTLSLPGRRWHTLNEEAFDTRLWQDERYHFQAARFWRDVAVALKGHPALVGLNLVNEPDPERAPRGPEDWRTRDHQRWCERVKGTASDLGRLYARIVEAIRTVDEETPVILDSSFYAHPWALACLRPLSDPRTLYAVHMYEPYAYTNHRNRGDFGYPGRAPLGEHEPITKVWNRRSLEDFLKAISRWQAEHSVPARRILIGEFGVFRWAHGAHCYLEDLITIFNAHGWHWAFWAFREDRWAHMDYELGPRALPSSYWERVNAGAAPSREPWYRPNPLLDAIRNGLKKRAPSTERGTP